MMNRYYRPTPLKWRKIGDTLLIISTTITTFAITEQIEWLAYVALFIGVVGKFLTNLFVKK